MRKIVRVLGKRGRITIPYEIRIRNNIGYNDILSFEEKDANTIILKKEKLCGGCTPECFDEVDDLSIESVSAYSYALPPQFLSSYLSTSARLSAV